MITESDRMNPRIQPQGCQVGECRVREIPANTRFLFLVELVTEFKIVTRFLEKNDIHVDGLRLVWAPTGE